MKLTMNGIKNRKPWEMAGIVLPGYDVEAVSEKAKKNRNGCILELAIFFAHLSVVLPMAFWRQG